MKYYKVLYKDTKDRLLSIGAAFGHPDELVLEYTPDEETIAPEGTKLFIFDGYINAQKFVKTCNLNHNEWAEIWEVKAEPIESVERIFPIVSLRHWNQPLSSLDKKRLLGYWQRMLRDGARSILITVRAPVGTLICNSVVLKRRIT